MSGIELGFAATQVADVGLRAALGLWRLASDLKNVPDKIDKAKRELDLLLALVNMIRADLDLATASSAPREKSLLTSAQEASAQALFNELKDQITALEVTLIKIDPNSKKGLKRAWRKVVSVEAEREVMSRCSRLEGLKGSLNVWYNHVSLLMIGGQISKTEGMAKIVETMEYKVRPLDESMTFLAGELKQMRTTIQSPILDTESRVNELGASVSSLSNGFSTLQCQIGSHHDSDKIHDDNAISTIQKTRSTSSGNRPCIGTNIASKDEEGRANFPKIGVDT
ncbi:MAG: hypothetical protein M1825_003457 [Sarcosagium campestre]|nr:MAG: hypothetical protein M1825_003457 [Sarcosagium campestre]